MSTNYDKSNLKAKDSSEQSLIEMSISNGVTPILKLAVVKYLSKLNEKKKKSAEKIIGRKNHRQKIRKIDRYTYLRN